jgi:hypothetical protein
VKIAVYTSRLQAGDKFLDGRLAGATVTETKTTYTDTINVFAVHSGGTRVHAGWGAAWLHYIQREG